MEQKTKWLQDSRDITLPREKEKRKKDAAGFNMEGWHDNRHSQEQPSSFGQWFFRIYPGAGAQRRTELISKLRSSVSLHEWFWWICTAFVSRFVATRSDGSIVAQSQKFENWTITGDLRWGEWNKRNVYPIWLLAYISLGKDTWKRNFIN